MTRRQESLSLRLCSDDSHKLGKFLWQLHLRHEEGGDKDAEDGARLNVRREPEQQRGLLLLYGKHDEAKETRREGAQST